MINFIEDAIAHTQQDSHSPKIRGSCKVGILPAQKQQCWQS